MLNIGDVFPTPQDQARIAIQNNYENLLLNKSVGNFRMVSHNGKISKQQIDPMVPLPQTVADISGDLLMGESPRIKLPDSNQKPFDEWKFKTNFESRLLEAATYTSAIGTVVSRMFVINGEVFYDFVPANKVIFTKELGETINAKFILSVSQTKNNAFLIYEIQEYDLEITGDVETVNKTVILKHYEIKVRISDTKIVEITPITEETIPGLDFLPVAIWRNVGIMGAEFGRSDYSGKEQLFAEIDNRIDQNNDVLQENAEPWKAVPPGILNQHGQLNRASMDAKMFEKAPGGQGDNAVDIITWDGSLDASFTQINEMEDLIFFTSRLSNAITGRGKGGTNDSGRSLKWQSISTIAMMNRKKRYAGDFLKTFVGQWSMLSAVNDLTKEDVTIEWQDGLPIDETEETATTIAQVNAQLMSKETAVKRLQNLNDEEAKKELERIQADIAFQTEQEQQASVPIIV